MKNPGAVKNAAAEGVFINGLFLEGASWSSESNSLVESGPKELYSSLPIVHINAVTQQQAKAMAGELGPYGGYDAPVYRYRCRGMQYLVTTFKLPSKEMKGNHWCLRGCAVICSLDS